MYTPYLILYSVIIHILIIFSEKGNDSKEILQKSNYTNHRYTLELIYNF